MPRFGPHLHPTVVIVEIYGKRVARKRFGAVALIRADSEPLLSGTNGCQPLMNYEIDFANASGWFGLLGRCVKISGEHSIEECRPGDQVCKRFSLER